MKKEGSPLEILHILSGDTWGGAEAQVLHQVSGDSNELPNSEILLFNYGHTKARFEQAGIATHLVPEHDGLLSLLATGRETIQSLSPRLLIAHGYKESVLAWHAGGRLGIPWISTFHGLTENYQGWAKVKMNVYQLIRRFLSRFSASRIVCVSDDLASQLSFTGMDKVRIIRNVSPLSTPSHSDSLQHPAIVVVGRLVPVKRVDLAIEAFHQFLLNDASTSRPHLYLIGDGPLRSELEDSVPAGIRSQVHFLGFRSDAASLISEADVYLLSSDSEGIPTSLLEATSFALPSVCTNVGGIPEVASLLGSYPLFLSTKGDVSGLCKNIELALKTSCSEQQKEAFRHSFTTHFSPIRAQKQLKDLFKELS